MIYKLNRNRAGYAPLWHVCSSQIWQTGDIVALDVAGMGFA